MQNAWLPLNKTHGWNFCLTCTLLDTLLFAAKTLAVFGLTESSLIAQELSTRNHSWPSAFSFIQLKSKSSGRCQFCITECMGQVFLTLGGNLLTFWFNRLTLFRSTLNNDNLKTATRPDMAEEKLGTISELWILSDGKLLSLPKFAPTIAFRRPNFRCMEKVNHCT